MSKGVPAILISNFYKADSISDYSVIVTSPLTYAKRSCSNSSEIEFSIVSVLASILASSFDSSSTWLVTSRFSSSSNESSELKYCSRICSGGV